MKQIQFTGRGFSLVVINSLIGVSVCIAFQPPNAPPKADPPYHDVDEVYPITQRQGWKPNDFFKNADNLALCTAISDKDDRKLEKLLESKIDLNIQEEAGFTVLRWAYLAGRYDILEKLMKRGADPDLKLTKRIELKSTVALTEGDSLLFTSLRQGKFRVFTTLVEFTRKPNQRDKHGDTILHKFLREFYGDSGGTVQKMIDKGVDVNAKGHDGSISLLLAAKCNAPGDCLVLLKAGADPSLRDNGGVSLADFLKTFYEKRPSERSTFRTIEEWLAEHKVASTANSK